MATFGEGGGGHILQVLSCSTRHLFLVCLLLAKSKIFFQVYWLVSRFCYCLSVSRMTFIIIIQIQLSNNKKRHGSVRCSIKAGLHQSGTSWYPVITASGYKVAVLIMSLINYVTHQYTNTTQNKSWWGSAISDCSFHIPNRRWKRIYFHSFLSVCLCLFVW